MTEEISYVVIAHEETEFVEQIPGDEIYDKETDAIVSIPPYATITNNPFAATRWGIIESSLFMVLDDIRERFPGKSWTILRLRPYLTYGLAPELEAGQRQQLRRQEILSRLTQEEREIIGVY